MKLNKLLEITDENDHCIKVMQLESVLDERNSKGKVLVIQWDHNLEVFLKTVLLIR